MLLIARQWPAHVPVGLTLYGDSWAYESKYLRTMLKVRVEESGPASVGQGCLRPEGSVLAFRIRTILVSIL